jgi:hypothetical protein
MSDIDTEKSDTRETHTLYSHEKLDKSISIRAEDVSIDGDRCACR